MEERKQVYPILCREPQCKEEIRFIQSGTSGKNIPVNAKPVRVVTENGYVINAYIPHWATCKNPNKFKKKKPNHQTREDALLEADIADHYKD